jgi:MATE family multidrug resistance protein
LGFAVPLMMGLMTTALHSIVDAAFVGRLGTAPLAALSMAGLYYFTGLALFIGLMRNSIAFTARAFGQGRPERIGAILAHYQWLVLLAVPLLWGFSLGFPLVAAAAGLSPQVAAQARIYLDVRLWEGGFVLTLLLYSSFYQSIGNSRLPMLVSWGALGLNVVLDYGLIFGNLGMPRMGMAGSALATVIAQAAGMAVILAAVYRPALRRRYALRFLVWPSWERCKTILAVGIPAGLGDLAELAGFLGFFVIVGRLGQEALAANNIGIAVTHAMFMPGMAAGVAAGSYMGRFIGAGAPGVARQAARRTLLVGLTYMGLMGLPLWFLGAEIAMIFTSDPVVISQAALMFKVMAAYQIFDATGMIMRGALNGAGDTRFPILALLVASIGVMYPLAWWLSGWVEPGLVGAWLGVCGYMVVLGSTLLLRFERGKWVEIKLETAA